MHQVADHHKNQPITTTQMSSSKEAFLADIEMEPRTRAEDEVRWWIDETAIDYEGHPFIRDLDVVLRRIRSGCEEFKYLTPTLAVNVAPNDVILVRIDDALADMKERYDAELLSVWIFDLAVLFVQAQVTAPGAPMPKDDVLSNLRTLLIEKNQSYGDSALNPIRLFAQDYDALAQILVRLDDKFARIIRGCLSTRVAQGEDTRTDILGYFVIFLMAQLREDRELEEQKGGTISDSHTCFCEVCDTHQPEQEVHFSSFTGRMECDTCQEAATLAGTKQRGESEKHNPADGIFKGAWVEWDDGCVQVGVIDVYGHDHCQVFQRGGTVEVMTSLLRKSSTGDHREAAGVSHACVVCGETRNTKHHFDTDQILCETCGEESEPSWELEQKECEEAQDFKPEPWMVEGTSAWFNSGGKHYTVVISGAISCERGSVPRVQVNSVGPDGFAHDYNGNETIVAHLSHMTERYEEAKSEPPKDAKQCGRCNSGDPAYERLRRMMLCDACASEVGKTKITATWALPGTPAFFYSNYVYNDAHYTRYAVVVSGQVDREATPPRVEVRYVGEGSQRTGKVVIVALDRLAPRYDVDQEQALQDALDLDKKLPT